ncbi:MAG: helicase [Actinomycetes bacterium]|nr:MAG: helicase [Actinomycetes bacterium]
MTTAELDAAVAQVESDLAQHYADGGRLGVVKAPPGSGKTHTLIRTLTRLATDLRIAVAAQTNTQADDIWRRLAETDPSVPLTRFASQGHPPPPDFPSGAAWTTATRDLHGAEGVVVSTSAKWALVDVDRPFDVLAVDEAWQMAWVDLMQCATVSERFLLIGDPGQIPPVVTIDVRRWETSPRSPHAAAPDVVLGDEALMKDGYAGSLPACRRLPFEAVPYIMPFYDFNFAPYVGPGERGVDLPASHRLQELADGRPLAVTLPTPPAGPPLEVDQELAAAAAELVVDLLASDATVRSVGEPRELVATDLGITSSHRMMNAAIESVLGGRARGVRVDTPERWQGVERPVMLAVHPMSGVTAPTAFDLDTGRLCVMASRHQAAHILITRDHVPETLANLVPSAEQAPGKPDAVGRGHDAHMRYWAMLEKEGRVAPLN